MDETLFHTEYEQVSDQLYTFLVRAVGDKDLAADLLQDAAYKAYRSRRQFRGDSTFKTWIYRIAVNTMKNQWVRTKRERKWFDEMRDMDTIPVSSPENLIAGIRAMAK